MANDGPRLDLKGSASTGGRPREIAVSADAGRLLVFHDDAARVTALDAARFSVLGHASLGTGAPPRRFLLGGRGELFYCAAPDGDVAVFDASLHRFSSTIRCAERPVDLRFLPDGERAFLALEDGEHGAVERRAGSLLSRAGRLDLRGRPVPETLDYSARLGLGAVLVRRPEGEVDLFVWRLEPFEPVLTLPVGGAAGALAFSPTEDLVFVSRPERHEVAGIGLPSGKVSRRVMMLGRAAALSPRPELPGVWALSEEIAHLVRVDLPLGAGPAPVRLDGLDPARDRLRFSPEGRLAVLTLALPGQILLIDVQGERSLADLLETGRPLVSAAWSPIGDTVYAAGADGSVSAFAVERCHWDLPDEHWAPPERVASKYPLFPP